MRTSRSLMFLPAIASMLVSEISALPSSPSPFSDTLLGLFSEPQPPPSELKPRMLMPDSPPSYPHPSSWSLGTQLPVSYRVAIAVDAFVLLITICSLICLCVYIRRQYRRRKAGLLHGHDSEFGFDDESSDENVDLKEEEAGLVIKDKGERKKKGHVRWTSSVVGMGPVGVWDGKVEEKDAVKGWGYDPRDAMEGGNCEVVGDARQTRVNLRVAAGYDGFRGN